MQKQYIDDIFIIWTGTTVQLQTSMSKINTVHCTIKFTHEHGMAKTNFFRCDSVQRSRVWYPGCKNTHKTIKPTNNYTSYHPKSVKTAILKQNLITTKLKNKLIDRGYKANEINEVLRNTCSKTILNNTHTRKKPNEPHLVSPVKFSQICGQSVQTYWLDIEGDTVLSQIFPSKPTYKPT